MTEPGGDEVTVRLRVGWPHRHAQAVTLGGRLVVHRVDRDSVPVLGPGVTWVEGRFPLSAGSHREPMLGFQEPVTLEVPDVPQEALAGVDPGWEFEVVGDPDVKREAVIRDALVSERDRLRTRVAEIEEILGDADDQVQDEERLR